MQKTVFLLSTFLVTFTLGTNVQFNNHCGGTVTVVRTENGQPSTTQCTLGAGQSCTGSFGGNGMNFKSGNNGQTLAEFTFNGGGGNDYYDLSVIVGYDVGMQISGSNSCQTITCTDPNCPDAYHNPPDPKTHACPTGGTFQVTFCP